MPLKEEDMQTTITRKMEWDMGHRIPQDDSLCKHLHGHRYSVELTIEGPIIDIKGHAEEGMIRNFRLLKSKLQNQVVSLWDHAFMVYKEDPLLAYLTLFEKNCFLNNSDSRESLRIVEVDFIPTAENIAAEIYRKLSQWSSIKIVEVTVWETPNCKATVKG